MNFIPHAASHGLWIRRLTKTKDGLSIYEQKCPGCAAPSIWPFGAEVVFKPSKAFNTTDKAAPRGRKGVMIDYVACPGGAWTGDYLVAELAHFEANSGRKTIRIHQTKTVTWNGSNRPYFPIFEAVELARKQRLADGVVERAAFTNTLLPSLSDEAEAVEDDESDAGWLFADADLAPGDGYQVSDLLQGPEEQALEQLEEERPVGTEDAKTPQEYLHLFRLGGWYRRLQSVDPSTVRKPHRGSARPADIHPIVWAGCGQEAQKRELECRRKEQEGDG